MEDLNFAQEWERVLPVYMFQTIIEVRVGDKDATN
jgi:hypothetical protein